MRRFVVGMFSAGMLVAGADGVYSQIYPNKPIRIVSSSGGNEIPARLIAQELTASMGQQVVVELRPSGVIPGQIVSQAPPDGYTTLVAGTTLWVGPLMQKTPYDPVRDFSPITLMTSAPNILVVYSLLPANSVKELIALAKAKPRELNYASSASGGSTHLAAELFKYMAGVDIVRIPYKDGATRIADLISGRVQLAFDTAPSVTPQIKSGRLRALAVSSPQPSALAPGVPTLAASGVPGYESAAIVGMFAPAKTPEAIIKRLNQEIVRLLNQPDVKQKFFDAGSEVVGSSPQEFAAKVESEIARLGKLIRDVGIKAD